MILGFMSFVIRTFLSFLVPAFLSLQAVSAQARITLNQQEYFEAPGFSFHPYHNDYRAGSMSGLQMVQNGERLLDSGDLYLEGKPGTPAPSWSATGRKVDPAAGTVTVTGQVEGMGEYRLNVRTDGRKIFVTLVLPPALDWQRLQEAGLRFAFFPGAYYGKSFLGESGSGIFPRQYTGQGQLLSGSRRISVAPEDPAAAVSFYRDNGMIRLQDNRRSSPQPWFSLQAPAESSRQTEVHLEITPRLQADYKRPPVLGVSQVGYHPNQPKRAILELDPQEPAGGEMRICRLGLDGEKKPVASGPVKPWGNFLRRPYAVFDFSAIREPGVYVAEYAGQSVGPFRIAEDVYERAWQPAIAYFLPIQMCHVAVKEGGRTWHGACHLDDARQAPAGKKYIDGYVQGERETKYADHEKIPGLDWGGWHDAGDHDLPSGSTASTTLPLIFAEEEFQPVLDDYTIKKAEREVLLHVPDGKSDVLQQIEYGTESLVLNFRVAGHILPGIIEPTGRQYGHLGDPVNVTDNKPCARPGEECDDRWVFTNRNTGLQYQVAQTLAAAARVLGKFNPDLAAEALSTARQLFRYEQEHAPVYAPNSYVPRDSGFRTQEIAAAAELLITTGGKEFASRLSALRPQVEQMTPQAFGGGAGVALVRALNNLEDPALRSAVEAKAAEFAAWQKKALAGNPYGVPYPAQVGTFDGTHSTIVWGSGWTFQSAAVQNYFFHKRLPSLFGKELNFAVADYVLGVHPANNQSLVSGVGGQSALVAYGTNRADWSHIPGGVISGPSLIRPDFLELKHFPFLWYQTEYVIHGAATYVFDLLAAQALSRP